MADSPSPTELLQAWRGGGSREAFDGLMSVLYVELERIAHEAMKNERPNHTLQTHALLHEAYVRLIDAKVDWRGRAHFLAVAARTMRRILVDHAKAPRPGQARTPASASTLTNVLQSPPIATTPIDMLVLSDSIDRLAAQDDRKAQIIELHFFGGLTSEETAEALELSVTTIERELRIARAWLRRDLVGPSREGARSVPTAGSASTICSSTRSSIRLRRAPPGSTNNAATTWRCASKWSRCSRRTCRPIPAPQWPARSNTRWRRA